MIKFVEFQFSRFWFNITILCYEPDNEMMERALFLVNFNPKNKWLNIQLLYGLIDYHYHW